METVRIQQNQSERIEAFFVNTASTPLSGLTPALTIRRQSDNFFLTSGQDFTSVFSQVTMSAVGTGTLAGHYEFTFDTKGLADADYSLIASGTGADNSPQLGELKVGDYVDHINKPISSIGLAPPITLDLSKLLTKKDKNSLIDDIKFQFRVFLGTFNRQSEKNREHVEQLSKKIDEINQFENGLLELIKVQKEEDDLNVQCNGTS